MSPLAELQTSAWYGDTTVALGMPDDWQVTTLWPDTPPPLDDDQIAEALERPVGQPTIRELARGKTRPLIIVDDLTRPTPAARVIPHVLQHLAAAGVAKRNITFLMATGTHGPPGPGGMEKKVGSEASSCRLLVHDHRRGFVRVGRTSFRTPVLVDREVAASDFVLGIGGVYPQNSTGFGGGSKLALGVLGRPSIVRLHYGHPSVKGSYDVDNDFRRDLDEIARMIGLHTTIGLHVDANREAVRIVTGDHNLYYRDAVTFAQQRYTAPLPGEADVVISNAYPMDVSLTMMHIKGAIPLLHAKPGASRVLVAGCPEGAGYHDLYPFIGGPRFARQRGWARSVLARPRAVPAKAAGKVRQRMVRGRRPPPQATRAPASEAPAKTNPIWLYAPGEGGSRLPAEIPRMTLCDTWERVVDTVIREQGPRTELKVVIYPCAPLHVLDLPHTTEPPVSRAEARARG
jgi:nickel-dependent lactate racemase